MQRRTFLAASAAAIAGCTLGLTRGAEAPSDASLDAAGFHAARRHVRTRFGDIAYVERGSGAAALFLHGFPLNGFQWRDALMRLSPYRRCIAPDFLGMGYTQVAEGQGCEPEAQVAMLIALLDELRNEQIDLIANDSGGAVAQ